MSWTYRVMRSVGGRTTKYYTYAIYEVYESPSGWTETPVYPVGNDLKELESDILMMQKALKLPVLDQKTGKPIADHQKTANNAKTTRKSGKKRVK